MQPSPSTAELRITSRALRLNPHPSMIWSNCTPSISSTGFMALLSSKSVTDMPISSLITDEIKNFTTRHSMFITGWSRFGAFTPRHWFPI